MDKAKNKYPKNRTNFSKPARQQYNLSAFEIDKDSFIREDGDRIVKNLQSTDAPYVWKKVNVRNIIKKGKLEDFILSSIVSSGFHPKEKQYSRIIKEEPFCSDFIFFDFDNKTGPPITFEKAHELLEDSGYNYILTTSYSHLKDDGPHKLQILMPVHQTIVSDTEHKSYYKAIYDQIFIGYEDEASIKPPSSRLFPSNKETFQIEYTFDRNDFHLDFKLHQIKAYKEISKSAAKSVSHITANAGLDEAALEDYSKMISRQFGLIVSREHSDGNALRYYRDSKDPVPSIFSLLNNEEFEQNLIFDKHKKSNGKSREYRTLFTYSDFENSVDTRTVVDKAREEISTEVDKFLREGGNLKRYLITNEGLGKSYSTLKLGKTHQFIYCAHTRKKLDEVEETLQGLDIKYVRIYSTEEILVQKNVEPAIVKRYLKWVKNAEDKSIRVFFDDLLEEQRNTNFDQYEKNLESVRIVLTSISSNTKKVSQNKVVIMTSSKLRVMLGQCNEINKPIIFDEFTSNEWYRLQPEPAFKDQKYSAFMPKSWGGKVDLNSNMNYYYYKHKSFLDTLSEHKVLVLSTEKRLMEDILHGSDYAPLSDKSFEFKIKSDNVVYLLVNSTRKSYRYYTTELFGTFDAVICNAIKGDNIHTHMSVKGLNSFDDKSLLIIGSMKPEKPVVTHVLNCISKYNDLFVQNKHYMSEFYEFYDHPRMSEISKKNRLWEIFMRCSEHRVQNVMMEAEVSQSLGRNQGYRARGKKTLVVLPVLMNNTSRRIKDIRLNYVSPEVNNYLFKTSYSQMGERIKFRKVHSSENQLDDISQHRNLVPIKYLDMFPDDVLRSYTLDELKRKVSNLNYQDYIHTVC
jgi:hypothetical protein